jgi:hypothetical protein
MIKNKSSMKMKLKKKKLATWNRDSSRKYQTIDGPPQKSFIFLYVVGSHGKLRPVY